MLNFLTIIVIALLTLLVIRIYYYVTMRILYANQVNKESSFTIKSVGYFKRYIKINCNDEDFDDLLQDKNYGKMVETLINVSYEGLILINNKGDYYEDMWYKTK